MLEAEADDYVARHGWHAYRLAGDRALDAYLLGDLAELERWSDIRALIREEVAPDASTEELAALLGPERRFPRDPPRTRRDGRRHGGEAWGGPGQ